MLTKKPESVKGKACKKLYIPRAIAEIMPGATGNSTSLYFRLNHTSNNHTVLYTMKYVEMTDGEKIGRFRGISRR